MGPLYRVHGGCHCLNLVTGASIEALRGSSSAFFGTLADLILSLRKQQSFIDEMRRQSPHYINVRWPSLESVLRWCRREMSTLETFIIESDSPGLTDLADQQEFWLTLILLYEHFTLIQLCTDAMQGYRYLLELQ